MILTNLKAATNVFFLTFALIVQIVFFVMIVIDVKTVFDA